MIVKTAKFKPGDILVHKDRFYIVKIDSFKSNYITNNSTYVLINVLKKYKLKATKTYCEENYKPANKIMKLLYA